MDQGSVALRLHVDPPIPGCSLPPRAGGRCRLMWSSDGTVVTLLHPHALFAPATTYHFHLDPGVRSRSGESNGLDHSWQLTTAPAPTVRATTPGDGASGVGLDSVVAVTFSTPMDPTSTAAAISLRPAPPGMRVVVNRRDPTRYVVVPAALLLPDMDYVVSIAATASDTHGQRLAHGVTVHFTTGGLGPAPRGVVLVRSLGAADPTTVLLTQLSPSEPGDPPPAIPVLDATRCTDPRCGAVVHGAPLVAYLDAQLSPEGHRLAVVERDETAGPTAAPALHLVDLVSGEDALVLPRATSPRWSPGGHHLAVVLDGAVHVVAVDGLSLGGEVVLPPGDPLDAAPVWSEDGSLLALPVRGADGVPRVDLADPRLPARFPLPGVAAAVSHPVFSPGGDLLAVRVEGSSSAAGAWVVRLRGGPAQPHRLGTDLDPVGFLDPGTLVAIARPPEGAFRLVRVSLAGGDTVAVPSPPSLDPASVTLTPDGRHLGYLAPDGAGALQAWVVNVDGSDPEPLTALPVGSAALSLSFGGLR